jgi:hypothetical protein
MPDLMKFHKWLKYLTTVLEQSILARLIINIY